MRIGKLLKLYMAIEEITTRQLGEQLNISASTISRICNEEDVDSQTLLKLIQWLFEGKD